MLNDRINGSKSTFLCIETSKTKTVTEMKVKKPKRNDQKTNIKPRSPKNSGTQPALVVHDKYQNQPNSEEFYLKQIDNLEEALTK